MHLPPEPQSYDTSLASTQLPPPAQMLEHIVGMVLKPSAQHCDRSSVTGIQHLAIISSKLLRPKNIKKFAMDEDDKMMSRGLKDQIHVVFSHLDQETKIILLSS